MYQNATHHLHITRNARTNKTEVANINQMGKWFSNIFQGFGLQRTTVRTFIHK